MWWQGTITSTVQSVELRQMGMTLVYIRHVKTRPSIGRRTRPPVTALPDGCAGISTSAGRRLPTQTLQWGRGGNSQQVHEHHSFSAGLRFGFWAGFNARPNPNSKPKLFSQMNSLTDKNGWRWRLRLCSELRRVVKQSPRR